MMTSRFKKQLKFLTKRQHLYTSLYQCNLCTLMILNISVIILGLSLICNKTFKICSPRRLKSFDNFLRE